MSILFTRREALAMIAAMPAALAAQASQLPLKTSGLEHVGFTVPDPRGHPLHVVVWLHQPGAPPDFAMNGEDPQPVPRPRGTLSHLDMAKKLLAKGADPNAPITWRERRFGSGGLARNPANLNIGRHYPALRGRHAVLSGGPQRRRADDARSRRRRRRCHQVHSLGRHAIDGRRLP